MDTNSWFEDNTHPLVESHQCIKTGTCLNCGESEYRKCARCTNQDNIKVIIIYKNNL